ncbi:MAG TPA: ABC transporter ATP-binding protein [Lacunisphaera sp.]|jgi:ABC-type polysaccharide/polyol phosphate transport system ATPase subunit
MSDDCAINVDGVAKAYRLWDNPSSRLTAPLMELAARFIPGQSGFRAWLKARAQKSYRDFWALEDISFKVGRGESLAIIGRNGSGKSTLLQIIAGTMQPSRGSVNVRGRIAALLELGSGFNPEFTGRENIHLNAALFGLTRAEIDARFADIVAFADIGDFIEQPVKIYSSGMVVRLAFAVAAHIDPDILIVDEALSVGDARFQLKCARAIDRFLAQGVTLLFVSHDTSMIKRLCKQAVLLEKGQLVFSGNPNDVVNLYSKLVAEGVTVADLADDLALLRARPDGAADTTSASEPGEPVIPSLLLGEKGPTDIPTGSEHLQLKLKAMEAVIASLPESATVTRRISQLLQDERTHVQVSGEEFSYGGTLGRIHSIALIDNDGQNRTWFSSSEPIIVRMLIEAYEEVPEPIFALTIKNTAGVEIYGTNTLFSKQPAPSVKIGTQQEVDFSFNLNLMPGDYFVSAGFTHFVGNELVVFHRRYDAIKFEIHGKDRAFGIANLNAVIRARTVAR